MYFSRGFATFDYVVKDHNMKVIDVVSRKETIFINPYVAEMLAIRLGVFMVHDVLNKTTFIVQFTL